MKNKRFYVVALLMSVLLTGQVFARDIEKKVEKAFDVKKGGTLILDTDMGSVKVSSHNASEVRITVYLTARTDNKKKAQKWFDDFDLTFNQNGSDVEVHGERHKDWFEWGRHLSVHFEFVVPQAYNVDLNTAGGSISVADLDGEAKVRTSGGSINLGEIGGSVVAKTSGGSISVDGADGDLIAKTSGGWLDLQNINGELEAHTSGGSIKADIVKQIHDDVELTTSGGSITLSVPSDFKADVDASTSGGHVRCELPITVRGDIGRNSLRGSINGGGKLVRLHTSGGSIRIVER